MHSEHPGPARPHFSRGGRESQRNIGVDSRVLIFVIILQCDVEDESSVALPRIRVPAHAPPQLCRRAHINNLLTVSAHSTIALMSFRHVSPRSLPRLSLIVYHT